MIIKTFRNISLSLNPNRSEDYKINIKDIPNLIVRDYNLPTNPIIISNKDTTLESTIILSDKVIKGEPIYIIVRESIEEVITIKENPNTIITNSGDNTDTQFDYESDEDFDNNIDSMIGVERTL